MFVALDETPFASRQISVKKTPLTLNFLKVDTLRDNKELPIVGMGKHLCGGATDLMLRCLMQQARNKAGKFP